MGHFLSLGAGSALHTFGHAESAGVIRGRQPLEVSSRSRRLQSFLDRLGGTVDDKQIGACRTFRLARPLFPMTQGVDAETEPSGELLLRHAQTRSDRLHVDPLGHMDAISALVGLALGIGQGFLEASLDAVGNLAHRLLLLKVSTRSVVNWRKSLRSCWLKSARSFLA